MRKSTTYLSTLFYLRYTEWEDIPNKGSVTTKLTYRSQNALPGTWFFEKTFMGKGIYENLVIYNYYNI